MYVIWSGVQGVCRPMVVVRLVALAMTAGVRSSRCCANAVPFSFTDDSKDLSTWERGAPAPQCLSEFLESQGVARAPRSRERRTSIRQDLVWAGWPRRMRLRVDLNK